MVEVAAEEIHGAADAGVEAGGTGGKTSNIQHPTLNIQGTGRRAIGQT
jgi:hypothetical protein